MLHPDVRRRLEEAEERLSPFASPTQRGGMNIGEESHEVYYLPRRGDRSR